MKLGVNHSALQNDQNDMNVELALNEMDEDLTTTTTTTTDPRQVTPTQTVNGLIGTEPRLQANLPMIAVAALQGRLVHLAPLRDGFPL
jgi:hypothetical protein